MDLLRAVLYGVSAQRPSHSLFVGGEQLPMEARMGGLFMGFALAVLVAALLGRLRSARGPLPLAALACWGLILATGVDGANAFLFDGRLPHLYDPSTPARLLSGLGAGYGLGFLALPVIAERAQRDTLDEPVLLDVLELAAGLVVALLLGAALLGDVAALLWPAALLMLASVLVGFTLANRYLLALLPGGRRAAGGLPPVGFALVELAVFGALRGAMAAAGITWGI